MKIEKEFGRYNAKRYSWPWIAKVTAWPTGQRAELAFGEYVGNDQGGVAEIEAEPRDIVRWGQKDYRNPKYTEARWGIVQADGSIVECEMRYARARFQEQQEA